MFNKTLTAIALAIAVVAGAPSAQAETITPDYQKQLSGWLESHKHYPDTARRSGEQGVVGLHFRVDRDGQVRDYAVTDSSGFADLDQSVKDMMHNAVLPAFPPSMSSPDIEVSVNIRFNLTSAGAIPSPRTASTSSTAQQPPHGPPPRYNPESSPAMQNLAQCIAIKGPPLLAQNEKLWPLDRQSTGLNTEQGIEWITTSTKSDVLWRSPHGCPIESDSFMKECAQVLADECFAVEDLAVQAMLSKYGY